MSYPLSLSLSPLIPPLSYPLRPVPRLCGAGEGGLGRPGRGQGVHMPLQPCHPFLFSVACLTPRPLPSALAVCRTPCAVCRVPCAVYHVPCAAAARGARGTPCRGRAARRGTCTRSSAPCWTAWPGTALSKPLSRPLSRPLSDPAGRRGQVLHVPLETLLSPPWRPWVCVRVCLTDHSIVCVWPYLSPYVGPYLGPYLTDHSIVCARLVCRRGGCGTGGRGGGAGGEGERRFASQCAVM